jgi:outer membrane protein TolC
MKHGKATVYALALFIALLAAGCAQKCCLHDYDDIWKRGGVPPDVECNPDKSCENTLPKVPRPTYVDEPEAEPWYITLHEAIAIALEKGTTGLQSSRLFGQLDDDLVTARQLGGNFFFGDSIRVLAYDPSIVGTEIEASLARYDVVARSIFGVTTRDFVANTQSAFQNGQFTTAGVSLEKANPYGGLAGITFGGDPKLGVIGAPNPVFSRFTNANILTGNFNPQYTPDLRFTYSQPLLRGWGPDINSLLPQHPEIGQGGAQQLFPQNSQGNTGIVIARIAFDQARTDFERAVSYLLTNVEFAYWNLYGSFVNLYATEQAMRMAHTTWKVGDAQYKAGKIGVQDVAQALGQYEQFRGDRLAALGKVLEAERTLRGLLGLPMSDGKRLVPVDTPTVSPYLPDWDSSLAEAKSLRPELVMQRTDLKQKQLELIREKNTLLPDLEFVGRYSIHGGGSRLDGNGSFADGLTDNALRSLASDHFADYDIGFTLSMPLGFRAQNAQVRAAKLRLAQSYYQLRDQEYRAERFLTFAYRDITEKYKTIEARRSERIAYTDQLEARFKLVFAGSKVPDSFLLDAQRVWATALQQEYQAIVDYNNALARFNFAKGTILNYDGVSIAEGELPVCAQVRAVEHERQRAAAIVCRERANVVANGSCQSDDPNQPPKVPQLPQFGTPNLSALAAGSTPTPANRFDEKEKLPPMSLILPRIPASSPAAPALTPSPAASPSTLPMFPSPAHQVPTTMPTTSGPLPSPSDRPLPPTLPQ